MLVLRELLVSRENLVHEDPLVLGVAKDQLVMQVSLVPQDHRVKPATVESMDLREYPDLKVLMVWLDHRDTKEHVDPKDPLDPLDLQAHQALHLLARAPSMPAGVPWKS